MNILVTFIIFNILNVIIQTIKSIATIKCGKLMASIVNAIAYGLYTYIVILTMCELSVLTKAIIVALCNLVGVYVVKYFEEKSRKDKLWKIEMTIPSHCAEVVDSNLAKIPHSYIKISDKHTLFNFYCSTQAESQMVKDTVQKYDAKYFVAESKIL